MYARGVNVNLTPLTSNRGALATDTRGCSLWRYLLECPPPTPESRVRDLLRQVVAVWTWRSYIGAMTRMGVRFRGVNVTDVYARGVNVNLTPLTSNRGALATDARGCSRLALLVRAPASRTGIPGSRPAPTSCGRVDPGELHIYISGGPLSALTCCVNVRLLSAIKKISPLIYSQSWVGSWVYSTQAMMTFTLIF